MRKYLLSLVATAMLLDAAGLTLTSDDLAGQLTLKQEFDGFGCKGENLSPQLKWTDVPKGTKSLALTVYDPDAPTGSGWWHWVVFDIPADVRSLPAGAGDIEKALMPKGAVQGITDYGKAGFGGACPPVGDKAHRYIFTLYALDVETLGLSPDSNPALVGFMINSHAIRQASLISYYAR